MNTKEKILDAALKLFSVQGFEDTSVAEIAAAVGIKAPSLYKHFKNKQAIFDAILEKMQQQYLQQTSMLQIDGKTPDLDAENFIRISEENLIQTTLQLFRFFLQDPYMAGFRRMMVLEQYKSPAIARVYQEQYFDGPLAFQTALFRRLCEAGILRGNDPGQMALQFYGPIFLLLSRCDHAPEETSEAEEMLRKHIQEFNVLYRKESFQ